MDTHDTERIPPIVYRCKACGCEVLPGALMCAACDEFREVGLRIAADQFRRLNPLQRRAMVASFPVDDESEMAF